MNKTYLYLIVNFLMFTCIYSQNQTVSITDRSYLNIGIGYAKPTYDPELQALINRVNNNDEVLNMAIGFNVGYYHSIRKMQTLMGISINGIYDWYEDNQNELISIKQYLFALSFINYWSDKIGSGVFLKADGGLAYSVCARYKKEPEVSDLAFGLNIGTGIAFKILNMANLHLGLKYSYNFLDQGLLKGAVVEANLLL